MLDLIVHFVFVEAAVETEGRVAGDEDVDEGAEALFSLLDVGAMLDGCLLIVDVCSASVTGPDGVFGKAHVGGCDDWCLKGGFPGRRSDRKEEWFDELLSYVRIISDSAVVWIWGDGARERLQIWDPTLNTAA